MNNSLNINYFNFLNLLKIYLKVYNMPRSRSRERSSSRSRSSGRERSRSSESSSSPIRVPPPSPISPIQNKTTNSITNTIIDGFAWGTGTTIAKRIFSSNETNENKHEIKDVKELKDVKDVKEINDKSDILWVKYNECIEKKDENKNCDKILLEDM